MYSLPFNFSIAGLLPSQEFERRSDERRSDGSFCVLRFASQKEKARKLEKDMQIGTDGRWQFIWGDITL